MADNPRDVFLKIYEGAIHSIFSILVSTCMYYACMI